MSGWERRGCEERTRTVNVDVEGLVGHVEVWAGQAAGEREDVGVMVCASYEGHCGELSQRFKRELSGVAGRERRKRDPERGTFRRRRDSGLACLRLRRGHLIRALLNKATTQMS